MLHVNDDMDEMFRKAAENYPLKTDNADWEKMQKKLLADDDASERTRAWGKRYLLLLLLLIPALWLGYNYLNTGKKKFAAENLAKQQASQKSGTSKGNIIDQKKLQGNTQLQDGTSVTTDFGNQDESIVGSNSVRSANKRISIPKSIVVTMNNSAAVSLKNKDEVKNTPDIKQNVATNNKINEQVQPLDDTNKNDVAKAESINNNIKVDVVESSNKQSGKTVDIKKDKIIKIQNKKQHSLYVGVMAAPDISFIKFQSVKNVGINAGFILGYQFNKRLSVETGLFTDKKFYYSDGKYFSTAKLYLPYNAKILNVEGDCRMLELPLNVTYNFKNANKSNWFALAGLSSYFMKKENYDYDVVTTGQPYQHHSSYNTPSTTIFSIINAGIGYNHAIGKIATLRIEPYIKIPLKGFGVGNLPIMSTGINIGITKKLF